MNKLIIIVISIVVIILIGIFITFENDSEVKQEIQKKTNTDEIYIWEAKSNIFQVYSYEKDFYKIDEGQEQASHTYFELKPELSELYAEIGLLEEKQNTIVIIPIFTASAYLSGGFYDYYNGKCDESCLTVSIVNDESILRNTGSQHGVRVLQTLGYDTITDIDVDKNPEILLKYDKVILMHNEYVTKSMFDAITSHPKVIYLYPNSLYAEITTNYDENTITLIRGHGYPGSNIINGFDWEYDNTHPYEFDTECKNWEFYSIDNGIMLNCYPEETIIVQDKKFLKTIKDF